MAILGRGAHNRGGCASLLHFLKGDVSRAYLSNAFNNVCSHHDGILLVEDACRENLEDAGEHSVQLCSLLLMLLDLRGKGMSGENRILQP